MLNQYYPQRFQLMKTPLSPFAQQPPPGSQNRKFTGKYVDPVLKYDGNVELPNVVATRAPSYESIFVKNNRKDIVEEVGSGFSSDRSIRPGLFREQDWWIDFGTKNLSFIAMHLELFHGGYKNNHFFLTLFNPELAGVDVHSEDLSSETKAAIMLECAINPYYFFREVLRVPAAGKKFHFVLHFASLALLRVFGSRISILEVTPRQTYKTTSGAGMILYLFRFVMRDTSSVLSRLTEKKAAENLNHVKVLHSALPTWMQFSFPAKADNTKCWWFGGTKNARIMTQPSATTAEIAETRGRGDSTPLPWDDEIAFTPYFDVIYSSSIYGFNTISRVCEQTNQPYGRLYTTTLSTLKTPVGQFVDKMIKQSLTFTPDLLDLSVSELRTTVSKKALNMMVYVYAPYNTLRYSLNWIERQYRSNTNLRKLKNEVLLQWQHGGEGSPFPEEVLDNLEHTVKTPRYVQIEGVVFRSYAEINPVQKLLLTVDTSGSGIEETAFVIDDEFQNTVLCCNSRTLTGPRAVRLIEHLCDMFPLLAVVIERNNNGIDLIHNLLETNCRNHLFYSHTAIRENVPDDTDNLRRRYGFDTTHNSRNSLIDIIGEMVIRYPNKFRDQVMLSQLSGLVVKKNGKVEHSSSTLDDLVIAKAIGCHVAIFNSRQLNFLWMSLMDSFNTFRGLSANGIPEMPGVANMDIPQSEDSVGGLIGILKMLPELNRIGREASLTDIMSGKVTVDPNILDQGLTVDNLLYADIPVRVVDKTGADVNQDNVKVGSLQEPSREKEDRADEKVEHFAYVPQNWQDDEEEDPFGSWY